MAKIPDIVPITDLRQDAAAVLRKVRDSRQPLVITQRGRATAVLVSMEQYERAEHERAILRALVQGDKEISAGEGYDLDQVMKEADEILDRAE